MNRYVSKIIKIIMSIISIPDYTFHSLLDRIPEKDNKFPDGLSIVTIAKNEGDYIREWCELYQVVGADRIYLYDNGSTDGMKEQIADFIDSGFVVYEWFPGVGKQFDAYNIAIRSYKKRTKYMAFLDCDEFLMPCKYDGNLYAIVDNIMSNSKGGGGISVNWRMYGSSGYITKPPGFVLENYLYRAYDKGGTGNSCIKTIANPRRIYKYQHPHYPIYLIGFHAIDEHGKKTKGAFHSCEKCEYLRINHYFTKSKEEWIKRRVLGKADTRDASNVRTIDEFYKHDNNDVYDEIGLAWAEKIHEANK